MSKLLIRITVILVAAYLICCYIVAWFGVDIWCQWYYLLFEACVCLCISKQGVYHCRFIKWTAYAILLTETLAYIDVVFDYMSAVAFIVIQTTILTAGIATTVTLAVRHYIRAKRIKKIWKAQDRKVR